MKAKELIFSVMLLVALVSCSDEPVKNDFNPIPVTRSETEVVNCNNDLSFKLLCGLSESDERENKDILLVSPLSVSHWLSMVANGANGETRKEILDALGFDDITILNDFAQKMQTKLPLIDNSSEFSLCNLLINDDTSGYTPIAGFGDCLKTNYLSDMLPLSNQSGISNWLKKKAHRTSDQASWMMSTIIDPFTLVQSMSFKGSWKEPFKMASRGVFWGYDVDSRVDYMEVIQGVTMAEGNKSYRLDLPFGNGAFNMSFLMPKEDVDFLEMVRSLDGEEWAYMNEHLVYMSGEKIQMPKFKVSVTENISEVLKGIGVNKVFDENEADFSNMSDKRFCMRKVFESVDLEISEKGAIVESTTWNGDPTALPTNFILNRPFVVLLWEKSTGAILMIGEIKNLR